VNIINLPGKFYRSPALKDEDFIFFGRLEEVGGIVGIKILEKKSDYLLMPEIENKTLYAKFKVEWMNNICKAAFEHCYYYPIVGEKNDFIDFDSCAWHTAFLDNKKFVSSEDKYEQICVHIKNLDHWLWDHELEGKFCIHDNDGLLTLKKYILHEIVEIDSKDFSITLHSNPCDRKYDDRSPSTYPNIVIRQNCYLNIKPKEPQSIEYFYKIIHQIQTYFTILWNRQCEILSVISGSEPSNTKCFYKNSLPWALNWSLKDDPSLFRWDRPIQTGYQHLKDDFKESLNLYFKIYDDFIINSLADTRNQPREALMINRIEILEAYGNIKSKGKNRTDNKEDLKCAIKKIPEDILNELFRAGFLCGEQEFYLHEMKPYLREILTEIRNYLIHPYVNGKRKHKENLERSSQYFTSEGGYYDSVLDHLLVALYGMIRWLFFKEIGLEKHYDFHLR
jgi:hypothetical protein